MSKTPLLLLARQVSPFEAVNTIGGAAKCLQNGSVC